MNRTPWATFCLLLANFVAAFFSLNDPDVLYKWGFTPTPLAPISAIERLLTALASSFTHIEPLHLLANMLLLAAAGPAFEKAVGSLRLLFIYVAGGLIGALVHWAVAVSMVPAIAREPLGGASACLAALVGYAWLRFGRTRVPLLPRVYVPLAAIILVWVALQVLGSFWTVGRAGGQVGYWAHLGGFVAGLGFALVFKANRAAQMEADEILVADADTSNMAAAVQEALKRRPNDAALLKQLYESAETTGDEAEMEKTLLQLFELEPAYAAPRLASARRLSLIPASSRVRAAADADPVTADVLLQSVLEEPPSGETPNALIGLIVLSEGGALSRVYAERLASEYALSPQTETARARWPALF